MSKDQEFKRAMERLARGGMTAAEFDRLTINPTMTPQQMFNMLAGIWQRGCSEFGGPQNIQPMPRIGLFGPQVDLTWMGDANRSLVKCALYNRAHGIGGKKGAIVTPGGERRREGRSWV